MHGVPVFNFHIEFLITLLLIRIFTNIFIFSYCIYMIRYSDTIHVYIYFLIMMMEKTSSLLQWHDIRAAVRETYVFSDYSKASVPYSRCLFQCIEWTTKQAYVIWLRFVDKYLYILILYIWISMIISHTYDMCVYIFDRDK